MRPMLWSLLPLSLPALRAWDRQRHRRRSGLAENGYGLSSVPPATAVAPLAAAAVVPPGAVAVAPRAAHTRRLLSLLRQRHDQCASACVDAVADPEPVAAECARTVITWSVLAAAGVGTTWVSATCVPPATRRRRLAAASPRIAQSRMDLHPWLIPPVMDLRTWLLPLAMELHGCDLHGCS